LAIITTDRSKNWTVLYICIMKIVHEVHQCMTFNVKKVVITILQGS